MNNWVCEEHPDKEFGHKLSNGKQCLGAGMPNRTEGLCNQGKESLCPLNIDKEVKVDICVYNCINCKELRSLEI